MYCETNFISMSRIRPPAHFLRILASTGMVALIGLQIVWTAYDFFMVSEGVQYFAARPQRLLHVLGIALAGTALVVVFGRLSLRLRRGLSLVLLGSAASGTTALLGLFICDLITLPPPLVESGLREGLLLIVPAFLLAASLFWFEFFRLFRQKCDARGESVHGS